MRKLFVLLVSIVLVFLSACGSSGDGSTGDKKSSSDPIVIGGKPWTEQRILPYILADYIKAKTDYPVKVHEGIGETNVMQQAIKDGDIDMYVEYTGAGYLDVLKGKFNPGDSADKIFKQTKQGYEKKFDITWLPSLGFENTYTLTTTVKTAQKYHIKKASDLVGPSKDLTFGAPAEFFGRADGYDFMNETYNFHFSSTKKIKADLMYTAVKKGDVDVIPAFTTDARIKKYNLAVTKDDKHVFPPYYAAPVVRMDTLKAHPKLKKVLTQLKGKISNEDMLNMNAQVDLDKKKPEEVAKEFLKKKGLIK